ncbi:MAG: MOSC domain-containing protein [Candidatus Eremiobacteraeota bacterium]|nr:MOSC domain-containing protein [Candidatus Eremiobacteraeota bacterium]
MMTIGTLRSIWRYPVKSLAPEALADARIDAEGIPGDRAQALIVRDGHARLGKPYRGKENNLLHLTNVVERGRALALERGVSVEPRADQAHYFDDAPISLIIDRWLNEASRLVGYELEPLRFRPNLFASATPEFAEGEEALTGVHLDIGTAVFRVRGPIERCVTPTYDQKTGESDPQVLRLITQHRATCLGIYCDVVTPGRVALGDSINRQ